MSILYETWDPSSVFSFIDWLLVWLEISFFGIAFFKHRDMDTSSIASNLWYVGLFVAALTGLCLVLGRTEKPILTLLFRKRPQATSPKKQKQNSYRDALPPQRRQALSKIAKGAVLEVDEQEISRHILPVTTDYQTCQDTKYTPTGFSVQEVRDLGEFPDYAELSGLPSPQPYHEFDIDKALPRPYRPFRWAYHQTMCMSPLQKFEKITQLTRHFISDFENGY